MHVVVGVSSLTISIFLSTVVRETERDRERTKPHAIDAATEEEKTSTFVLCDSPDNKDLDEISISSI